MVDARTALDELDRVGQAVRLRSRWYGHFLALLGAGTVAYFAAVNLAVPATTADIVALSLGWTTFIVLLTGWARRQPVVWRGIRQLRPPLMLAYYALVAATVTLNVTVLSGLPARWALGIVPAVPCLAGAWLVLRREPLR
jgi:hypothetical protein